MTKPKKRPIASIRRPSTPKDPTCAYGTAFRLDLYQLRVSAAIECIKDQLLQPDRDAGAMLCVPNLAQAVYDHYRQMGFDVEMKNCEDRDEELAKLKIVTVTWPQENE